MAKMSKAERIYAAQQAYDDMILEAKIQAQAQQDEKRTEQAVIAAAPAIKVEKSDAQLLKEWEEVTKGTDRKSTRLNSSHIQKSRMPSSA